MIKTHFATHKTVCLIFLCLCLLGGYAFADGIVMMPEPPQAPVYWQLTSIGQEASVSPSGGYSVDYNVFGLSLDLEDGLMTESLLLSSESWDPQIDLDISKGDAVMHHAYSWTALPVYLEKGQTYTVDVSGAEGESKPSLNSLLYVYVQGERVSRISAGQYTGHDDAVSFDISTSSNLYGDGSIVISFVIRDVNDMFTLRIAYTYTMIGGVKPVPTPVPGFVAVEAAEGVVPEFYDAVEGAEGLWHVTTAAEEYRAYGSMSGSDAMFFAADSDGTVVMNAPGVNPADDFAQYVEGFVATEPSEVPAQYRVLEEGAYGFTTRGGEIVRRVYGRIDGGADAFYPADENGIIVEGAQPVQPDEDFEAYIAGFGAATPDTDAPYYEAAEDGLYEFTGRDGETRYRVYGRLDGAEPQYYPADAQGEIIDSQPVTPQQDFESYIKGFDGVQPQDVPTYYEPAGDGLWAVSDADGGKVYRVYGVLDGKAPAYYPADAEGTIVPDADPVTPQADYEAYVMGFVVTEPAEVPDFYEETGAEGVWFFVNADDETQYRAYGELNRTDAAFYPSDAEGNVAPDALPVQPASDRATLPVPVFEAQTPETVPSHYSAVVNTKGLYCFEDRNGDTIYRVYGAKGDAGPAFFPADASGEPLTETPIQPEDDIPLLPTPYAYSVVTPNQQPGTENTPIARQHTPTAPSATDYSSQVVPEATADDAGNAVVSRAMQGDAQSPEATNYDASVVPQADSTESADVVSRAMATDAQGPEPTNYGVNVAQQPGSTGEGAAVVGRAITPGAQSPEPTNYDASVTQQASATGTSQTVASDQTGTQNPAATTYGASVTQQASATDASQTVASNQTGTQNPAATSLTSTVQPTAEGTDDVSVLSRVVATEATQTGASTEEPVSTPTEDSPTEEPTLGQATEEPTDAQPGNTPKEDKTSGSNWWIALVVLGVAGLGGGGYAIFRKKK